MHAKKLSLGLATVLAMFAVSTLMTATSAAAQTESVLISFTASDPIGAGPYGGVIKDSVGNLYGTTEGGGANGLGTVYQLAPPAVAGGAWTLNVLYNFTGSADGGVPLSTLVFDSAGNLYGTAYRDGSPTFKGGVVFELSPPAVSGGAWTYTVLYTFGNSGSSDGANPWGNLIFDSAGNLYGVTFGGGSGSKTFCGTVGCGIAYELSPPSVAGGAWTENVVYNFAPTGSPDGFTPNGVLFGAGGVLYGTASQGGLHGVGTFFRLTPPSGSGGPWTERNLYHFGGSASDAAGPNVLTAGAGGVLFGTSEHGGSTGAGTVFELKHSSSGGWTESVLYSFLAGSDGETPVGGVTLGGAGNLFGTTLAGGNKSQGTVFRLKPPAVSGGAWTKTILHNFTNSPDGSGPFANLLLSNGTLFGTTETGGPSLAGVVFSVVP
jgi:uncharacterized repeat protein (TIGR03803 family)